ncbi:MAG: hypothetical protein WAL91_06620, partial [Propionicimonas sp.]
NIGWMVHGLVIGQVNLVVPNLVGMFCTSIVLWFLATDHGRPLYRIALPGLWVGAGMIATDLLFGSAVYGVIAVLPAVVANVGGSVELVRAPSVIGVSPVALIGNVLNQLLWSVWGLLVSDSGTIIAAGVTLVIALFNQVWWILRRLGLRPLLVRPGVYVEAS